MAGIAVRRRLGKVTMKAAASAETGDLSKMKSELFGMVGQNGGLDLSPEQKASVKEFAQRFAGHGMEHPEQQQLTGTSWKMLFTESEGTSSGKIGPFIGSTAQEFPKDRTGMYINTNELFGGFLRLELEGEYGAGTNNKIDLEFKFTKVFVGGAQMGQPIMSCPISRRPLYVIDNEMVAHVLKKDFPPNFKGFWKCVYADDGLRIFYTNKNNMFIMYNSDAGKTAYNWSRYDKKTFI